MEKIRIAELASGGDMRGLTLLLRLKPCHFWDGHDPMGIAPEEGAAVLTVA
jgi:hypothetical protein